MWSIWLSSAGTSQMSSKHSSPSTSTARFVAPVKQR
ncbi:MAG: hypothetical protein JWO68_1795, partial [Actinomycetia bacterium]|nr:hypothetical protein [Actinomycetes bacterium]